MIANPRPSPHFTRDQWADRLVREINTASSGLNPLPVESILEVARGVAAFVDERLPAGVPLESERLIAMTSQALSALGEKTLARRLLIFGCGLVHPAEWTVGGERTMLILDLKRLTVLREDCLELVLFRTLGVCLDSIADTWDAARGDGTLGLRNLGPTARAFGTPRRRAGRHIAAFADEVIAACRAHFETLRQQRGWETVPHVILLDRLPTSP